MTQEPTQSVAEIVTFKLAQDVQPDHYLELTKPVDDFLETCPGFVFRRVSSGEDGRWTDTAIWSNMETAKAAAEAFPQQSFAPKVMAAIDGTTLEMRHEVIHSTRFPPASS